MTFNSLSALLSQSNQGPNRATRQGKTGPQTVHWLYLWLFIFPCTAGVDDGPRQLALMRPWGSLRQPIHAFTHPQYEEHAVSLVLEPPPGAAAMTT